MLSEPTEQTLIVSLSLLFFNKYIRLYLLLAVLVFVASHRLSLVVVRGLLSVVAFLVEHRL